MCYDLVDIDPFHSIYTLDYDGLLEIDSEPMTDEDWEAWLENENILD